MRYWLMFILLGLAWRLPATMPVRIVDPWGYAVCPWEGLNRMERDSLDLLLSGNAGLRASFPAPGQCSDSLWAAQFPGFGSTGLRIANRFRITQVYAVLVLRVGRWVLVRADPEANTHLGAFSLQKPWYALFQARAVQFQAQPVLDTRILKAEECSLEGAPVLSLSQAVTLALERIRYRDAWFPGLVGEYQQEEPHHRVYACRLPFPGGEGTIRHDILVNSWNLTVRFPPNKKQWDELLNACRRIELECRLKELPPVIQHQITHIQFTPSPGCTRYPPKLLLRLTHRQFPGSESMEMHLRISS